MWSLPACRCHTHSLYRCGWDEWVWWCCCRFFFFFGFCCCHSLPTENFVSICLGVWLCSVSLSLSIDPSIAQQCFRIFALVLDQSVSLSTFTTPHIRRHTTHKLIWIYKCLKIDDYHKIQLGFSISCSTRVLELYTSMMNLSMCVCVGIVGIVKLTWNKKSLQIIWNERNRHSFRFYVCLKPDFHVIASLSYAILIALSHLIPSHMISGQWYNIQFWLFSASINTLINFFPH